MAFSAYSLPRVEALVQYLHATAGFPIKSTWLATIKAGKYVMWKGLTFYNTDKYFPESRETIKVHMVQTHQGVCSTKPKPTKSAPAEVATTETPVPLLPGILSIKIHIYEEPIRKMYTNDFGQFPIKVRSGNQYIMIKCNCDTNII